MRSTADSAVDRAPQPTVTIRVADEAALGPLAAAVAGGLPATAFLALTGDLGAGKTTFVKALAAAAGIDAREVVSPTFGLIHVHTAKHRLVHADMYRLPDVADLHETGWDDAISGPGWVAVEWPERITAALPDDRLDVALSIESPTARSLTFVARGPRHAAAVEALTRLSGGSQPCQPRGPGGDGV